MAALIRLMDLFGICFPEDGLESLAMVRGDPAKKIQIILTA